MNDKTFYFTLNAREQKILDSRFRGNDIKGSGNDIRGNENDNMNSVMT